MKQKVTIDDVAKYCHVSKSSVSRYLNHGYVSAKNKEIIQQAIDKLGFERDFFASRIKAKHTRLLGIVVNDLKTQGHARILEGMQRKMQELNYQGMIFLSNGKQENECLQEMLTMGADGVIFLDCVHPKTLSDCVLQKHAKVLFAKYPCEYAPFLDLDEKRAGTLMGEFFLKKHASRFVYLQQDKSIGKKRMEGFAKAYEGVPCEIKTVEIAHNADAYDKMKEVIAHSCQVVLCENEEMALAAFRFCHELHIHIPQNLSFACFGSGDISQYSFPALTTLIYQYESFGANLIEEMAAINEGREPHWEAVDYQIIERESVCSYE